MRFRQSRRLMRLQPAGRGRLRNQRAADWVAPALRADTLTMSFNGRKQGELQMQKKGSGRLAEPISEGGGRTRESVRARCCSLDRHPPHSESSRAHRQLGSQEKNMLRGKILLEPASDPK
jgi:hypothetical protein